MLTDRRSSRAPGPHYRHSLGRSVGVPGSYGIPVHTRPTLPTLREEVSRRSGWCSGRQSPHTPNPHYRHSVRRSVGVPGCSGTRLVVSNHRLAESSPASERVSGTASKARQRGVRGAARGRNPLPQPSAAIPRRSPSPQSSAAVRVSEKAAGHRRNPPAAYHRLAESSPASEARQ